MRSQNFRSRKDLTVVNRLGMKKLATLVVYARKRFDVSGAPATHHKFAASKQFRYDTFDACHFLAEFHRLTRSSCHVPTTIGYRDLLLGGRVVGRVGVSR